MTSMVIVTTQLQRWYLPSANERALITNKMASSNCNQIKAVDDGNQITSMIMNDVVDCAGFSRQFHCNDTEPIINSKWISNVQF